MTPKQELPFLFLICLGVLMSQSPYPFIGPITFGFFGIGLFILGIGAIAYENIKGIFDITAQ